jgi:phosphomevalonate kinase
MTDYSDEERARHANNLLQNKLFIEAFDILKTDLMSRWNHSGSTESEARESIWLAMRLLDRIEGHIKSIVETGHMAKVLDKQHPFI